MRLPALLALCILGCSHAAQVAPSAPPSTAYDPARTVATKIETVELTARDHQVPATIVAPAAPGPWPAIVLMQGSGPTDRDWNSPMIPTKNGSGKLLAEELAKHGAVVIRFDKAGSGGNKGPADMQSWSLDTYRDELLAALAAMNARPDVRPTEIFFAGHSEGGLHVARAALEAGARVHGILFLSSVARSLADTMVGQLDRQLHGPRAGLTKEAADAELASVRTALRDFTDGKSIEPMKVSTIGGIQQLLLSLTMQPGRRLLRELLSFDLTAHVEGLAVPCLVLNGGHDMQVSATVDGGALVAALTAARVTVEHHVAPEADHVLKHQPESIEQMMTHAAEVQAAYNAEGRVLDPDAVFAIETWLAAHTR